MPVKRDDQRHRVVQPRIRHRLPDDLLMPQMHAVKNPDGQTDFAAAIAQFVCGVNDFHKFFGHGFSRMKHR